MLRPSHCGWRARASTTRSELRRGLALCASIFGLALVGGCGSDSNRGIQPTAGLRVVNAVADSRLITVELNEATFSNLSYAQASPLQRAVARDVLMDVVHLTPEGVAVEALDNFGIPFDNATEVTVVLTGQQAAPSATLIVQPEFDATAGTTEIHFFNGVTNGPRLEFHLVDPAQTTVSGPGATVVAARSPGLLLTGTPGQQRLLVTREGDSAVLYDSGQFALVGSVRTLFVAVDYFGPGSQTFKVLRVDEAQATEFANETLPVELRVAQMIADLPTVDVYIGDTADPPDLAAVAFGVSGYVDVPAGGGQITVTMESSPTDVLFSEPFQPAPGTSVTLLLAGANFDSSIDGRIIRDTRRPVALETQFNIAHASRSAGLIDVYITPTGNAPIAPVFGELRFMSNAVLVGRPDAYDIQVNESGGTTIVHGPQQVELEAGQIYTLWIADAEGAGLPPRVVLADGFGG